MRTKQAKTAKKSVHCTFSHLCTVAYYSPLLTGFTFTLSAFWLTEKLAKLAQRTRSQRLLTFPQLTSINAICSRCAGFCNLKCWQSYHIFFLQFLWFSFSKIVSKYYFVSYYSYIFITIFNFFYSWFTYNRGKPLKNYEITNTTCITV